MRPRNDEIYVFTDQEQGVGIRVEENLWSVNISLLDLKRVGIHVSITVRKGTSLEVLAGFLESLPESAPVYIELYRQYLAERTPDEAKHAKESLKERLRRKGGSGHGGG